MTPHDELMALAGKATPGEWSVSDGPEGYQHRISDGPLGVCDVFASSDAAFIAAACNFVRSDAFRAMARNDARYRWLRANAEDISWPSGEVAGLQFIKGGHEWLDAAIDAAASGAITPPTSEGEK